MGLALRDNARFCDGCGAAVNAPPERAEYKQVTVLFADVVESMRLVQRPLGWGCEAIDAGGGLRTKVGGWGCPGWSVYASGFVLMAAVGSVWSSIML